MAVVEAKKVDIEALALAKQKIQEIVEREWLQSKLKSHSQLSRRFSNRHWILNLAGLRANQRFQLEDPADVPSRLSQLIRISDNQLRLMALFPYEIVSQSKRKIFYSRVYKYGRKLCPICLLEFCYCRQIWDCDLVKACPLHQCLLINKCDSCQQEIKWSRRGVARCHCGGDFCNASVSVADSSQINLSRYLYTMGSG